MDILKWFQDHLEIDYRPLTPLKELTRIGSRTLLNGKPTVVIQRNTKQLWEEIGWRFDGDALQGYYRTRFGSYKGRIEKPFSSQQRYFILHPPPELLEGHHGSCFKERGRGCFEIHWLDRPDSVNTGILRVAQCIREAFEYE